MAEPIVLQLQADCLDAGISISTQLRKAKLIASKLSLDGIGEWLENELNGYSCAWKDLPSYRTGLGMPKFFNPFHGWLDIVIGDGELNRAISTCYLPQAMGEIEHLISTAQKGFVILGFPAPTVDFLHANMDTKFNCGLHVSTTVLVGAIEGVRNAILEWTLALEREGVLGEGLSFSKAEIERAHSVTNHIYGGNIGVVGSVAGDANNSHFVSSSGVDVSRLKAFLEQAIPASDGLDEKTKQAVQPLLRDLHSEAGAAAEPGKVRNLLKSLRTVLEGASGNLVASAILGALTGSVG